MGWRRPSRSRSPRRRVRREESWKRHAVDDGTESLKKCIEVVEVTLCSE